MASRPNSFSADYILFNLHFVLQNRFCHLSSRLIISGGNNNTFVSWLSHKIIDFIWLPPGKYIHSLIEMALWLFAMLVLSSTGG